MTGSRWTVIREVINALNTSTLIGFVVARAGGASIERWRRGTWLATGYRFRFPVASAFTVGNVIITAKSRDAMLRRTALLRHEDRHCTQFAFCLGPVMLPLYFIAMGVSWLLTGSHATLNPFERLANLDDGGYVRKPLRFKRSAR